MNEKELIKEHKRLVRVLEHGSPKDLRHEASIQKNELRKYVNDYCPRCAKRREHIKHSGIKMCKSCGYQERYNPKVFL